MRWLCLGMVLGGCGAESAAPDNGANDSVSSADDSGTSETDDSGTSETDDSGNVDTATVAASLARGAAIVDSVCEHATGPTTRSPSVSTGSTTTRLHT